MPYTHGLRHFHHHSLDQRSHDVPVSFDNQPFATLTEHSTIVRRASTETSTCTADNNSAACAKPTSSSLNTTLPVVLGAVIPVVCAVVVLIFLHRRHVRKLRAEDANDKHKSLDFGMEVVRAEGKPYPELGEKPHKRGGMSLDIGSSPYLLPPGLHNSKESLRSLSKVISADDDKYRLAAQSDNASLRSYRSQPKWGHDDASSIGTSTRHAPIDDMNHGLLQNASGMSRSSPPAGTPSPTGPDRTLHRDALKDMPRGQEPSNLSGDGRQAGSGMPTHLDMDGTKNNGNQRSLMQEQDLGLYQEPAQDHLKGEMDGHAHSKTSLAQDPGFGGFNFGTETDETSFYHDDHSTVHPPITDPKSAPLSTPRISLPLSDAASDYGDEPKSVLPPSLNVPIIEEDHVPVPEEVAPRVNRMTQNFPGLNESYDPHRLTVGIRPLPPEDPSDNAEQRANRIRSFYKEYFDDTKGAPEEYYEDFGPEFYEDAAVYDPYTGDYLMGPSKPFAQSMGRRAMTPPPRFQGPPRQMMHSSAGFRNPGPRAFSSASGRLPAARGPRKPLPPPEPLHVLPSPHLIKDDMSVLPIDYAPGKTYKDQKEGRPETPRGGLRPYTPVIPSHSPLMSSFDDLAAIPSPHALRKSGIFMPLGFAPPARFKNDTGSDAGSIRSNRTGISATHLHNIRTGAYRVSRLPADTVGTKDDIHTSLKPSWDMR